MNSKQPVNPDSEPAHRLWVQLETRITTQKLHYRSGDEETAAQSVASVFATVRQLLDKYPDARAFSEVSVTMLNEVIRPYTARWHGWMIGDPQRPDRLRFPDAQVRRTFRKELQDLQAKLGGYQRMLARLAHADADQWAADVDARMREVLGDDLAGTLRKDRARRLDQVGVTRGERTKGQRRAKTKPVSQGMGETDRQADLGGVVEAGIGLEVFIAEGEPVEEINRKERQAIQHRRDVLNTHPGSATGIADAEGGSLPDATGLSLSGGGIRSATFSLGIVQVLVKKGLLHHFDYLSTVSGGGYLGSFLSCALGTCPPGGEPVASPEEADAKIKDVFQRESGPESGLIRHLRNNSKYLLHGGLVGKSRVVGLLLSGLLWNLMILLPVPLFAALLAYGVGDWLWGEAVTAGKAVLPSWTSPSGWFLCRLAIVFGVVWLLLPAFYQAAHGKPPRSGPAILRGVWVQLSWVLGVLTVFVGLVFLTPALFHGYEWFRVTLSTYDWSAKKGGDLMDLLPASAAGVISAVLATLSTWLSPRWPRLRGFAVRLFILSGPVFLLLVFLLVVNSLGFARAGEPAWSVWLVLVSAVGLAIWGWAFVNVNTLAPHRFYRDRLCECYLARRKRPEPVAATAEGQGESEMDRRVEQFQRYVASEPAQGRTEALQQVNLEALGSDPVAPYHLINMSLNVPSSENKNLRGRGSDFFVASRHFCGAPITGYRKTEAVVEADPHFDLGTAMAVSGAAASGSMGWKSLPHFRFLMTLFNVRLGYWLCHLGTKSKLPRIGGPGPICLFREMLGRMDETGRYLNLSDGGHIENLGAYELLRRRCKFMVCVDGGCEPNMECTDLVRLQRYAEIDLGIHLHYDLADLQIESNGLCRAHAILVKVEYPGEKLTKGDTPPRPAGWGWMLYVKLAMIGTEPIYVKDYRRENPTFPHQSTGDQMFDEAQFEAYRALGECAVAGLFRGEIVGAQEPTTIRAWFQRLADSLLPDNDAAFAKASLRPRKAV